MSAEVPNQTNINKGSSFRARRLIDQWPLLVWAAMLGLVLYLYSQRGVNVRVNGMIAAHNEEISATEDGVILEVLVKEGDKVAKGQELVKLDSTLIKREIEDYKANLPFVKADMQRKFKSTKFGINADLQRAKSQKASSQSRLEAAQQNVELIKINVEQQLSLQSELDKAINRVESIENELLIHNESIDALTVDLDEADDLLKQLDSVSIPEELFVLKQRLANKILIAPGEGTIHKINKLGGVIKLGEPILSINITAPGNARPKTIRALIPQDQNPQDLSQDGHVWISLKEKNPKAYKAKIITVSPSIEALPNYNTPIRGQYIRGRIVVCELPEDFEEQLPGTGVHVHLTEPGNFDIWDFGRTPIKAASN